MPGIDSYTKFCLVSGSAADNSTTFVDSSTNVKDITVYGNVHHDTDSAVFGTSAIKFDGVSDVLYVENSSDFEVGSGAFTIEMQSNPYLGGGIGIKKTYLHDVGDNTFTEIQINATSVPGVNIVTYTNGIITGEVLISALVSINDNEYHHIELDYSSGTFYFFIDGTRVTNEDDNIYISGTIHALTSEEVFAGGGFFIGGVDQYTSSTYHGYFDQIRFSFGTARHTSNFTPPAESYDSVNTIDCSIVSYVAEVESESSTPIQISASIEPLLVSVHGGASSPIQIAVDIEPPLAIVFGAEQTYINCTIEPLRAVVSSVLAAPYILWGNVTPKNVIILGEVAGNIGINCGISPSKPLLNGVFADNNIRLVAPFPVVFGTMEQVQQINCGIEAHAVLNGSMDNEAEIDVSILVHAKLQSNVTYNRVSTTITYDKDRRCRL